MSEPKRVVLVGATGLVGRAIMRAAVGRSGLRLTALSRREYPLPVGARMAMCVAEPKSWGNIMEGLRPQVLISALGTTWKKAGKDENSFRAVDQDLVLQCAQAARKAGVSHMICISAIGARLGHRSLYLRVKGQVENDLARMNFPRLDILQPSLLRGQREDDLRPAERAGQILAPAGALVLHGGLRRYRAIAADDVARAALNLAMQQRRGRYSYQYDEIMRWSDQDDA